jgi:hypothetical protein
VDDGAGFEDTLQPGTQRSWVVGSVRSRVSLVGNNSIGSVIINEDRHHLPVPLTDLAALHAQDQFVPPPGYEELKAALRERRIVICHGPDGCGKELAVTRALLENDAGTVRLLPASLDISLVRRVIEAIAETGGACVLPGLDEGALRTLAGIAGQSVQVLVAQGQVKVVALTGTAATDLSPRSFAVARLDYPDATGVLDSYCASRSTGPDIRDLASEAISLISPPLSPAVIVEILDRAAADSGQAPAVLAASFSGALTAKAVQAWATSQPRLTEVAALAAGASLPGASELTVQEEAVRLLGLLSAGQTADSAQPSAGQQIVWAPGLLCTRTQQLNTHFGIQPLGVVDVAKPHQPHQVIQAVWRNMDAGFRSAYCDWLSELPDARQLRWHAAYVAGVLFAVDPAIIEARVLRNWLRTRNPAGRACAGLALGAPVAIDADCSGARKLAHHWATSDSVLLKEAAVAAYGGPLGAWDTASAAPLKLFLIGQARPELRGAADRAMASLIVSGAYAIAARTTVIAYLKLAAEIPSARDRAYGCLPGIVRALALRSTVCAESLAALRGEEENWAGLVELLGGALVSPAGVAAGQRSLELLVRAVADGRVDYEIVEDVIRGTRAAQRPLGNVPRLGTVIRRTLVMLSRSADGDVRDVVVGLLKQFFKGA